MNTSKSIELTEGEKVIVDSEDYERLSKYKWYLMKGKNNMYVFSRVNEKTVYMHRFIMNVDNKGTCIDHIDGNTLDNRKKNLRECSYSQNMWNLKKIYGKSKFKGVTFVPSKKKWGARICVNGNGYQLAWCKEEEDAAIYYNVAAQLFFGEYAHLNDV